MYAEKKGLIKTMLVTKISKLYDLHCHNHILKIMKNTELSATEKKSVKSLIDIYTLLVVFFSECTLQRSDKSYARKVLFAEWKSSDFQEFSSNVL